MKIYIIEHDCNVKCRLQQIIASRGLGEVIGMSENWKEAFFYIEETGADVVLAGLSLPQREMYTFLDEAQKRLKSTALIILLQNGDKDMVRRAYEKGAEFVLHKPLCDLEIDRVLRNVEMARMMKWVLQKAGHEFLPMTRAVQEETPKHGELPKYGEAPKYSELPKSSDLSKHYEPGYSHCLNQIKGILGEIGILSEAGSKDIMRIARYLMENDLNFHDITLKELCSRMGQNTKSVEQRVRRAAFAGMVNLACRGLEDYADRAFLQYAGKLYQMDQVRQEMNYQAGKSELRGCVRLRKFLINLLECCQNG